MQPCEVCGGMGIDANGYCTQCRTYRGIPGQASYPQSPAYPPTGGYQQQPMYGQQPQQYQHSQQYQQPTYAAPVQAPPKQRNAFTIPLIALSATLVVVVVGIVAVVLIRNGGDTPENPGGAIDSCVVGTWEVTDYSEDVAIDNVGKVTFTDKGKGAVIKFGKDGKGIQDFGSGTLFTGSVQGATVNLEISGTIRYDFKTNGSTISYSNLVSDGKAKISIPAVGREETQDFTGSDDPSKYTCTGDKMTMSTSLYRADLKKTGATA